MKENIIYILIGIAWVIYNLWKKGRKTTKPAPGAAPPSAYPPPPGEKPEHREPEQQRKKKSIFEEILSQSFDDPPFQLQAKKSPPADAPEPTTGSLAKFAARASEHNKAFRLRFQRPQKTADQQKQPPAPFLPGDETVQSIMKNTTDTAGAEKTSIPHEKSSEPSGSKNPLDDFNIKTAVLFSEILNRPYS